METVQYPTSLAIVSRSQILPESSEKFYRSCGTGCDEFLDLGDPGLKFECPRRLVAKTIQELLKGCTLAEN